mmetsp:Transcript_20957/g.58544  ORF Transcript_20957/g.58544 Transcript_20957/m.58544 type:complete len:235 (+) Transcript_20957:124-828(+)
MPSERASTSTFSSTGMPAPSPREVLRKPSPHGMEATRLPPRISFKMNPGVSVHDLESLKTPPWHEGLPRVLRNVGARSSASMEQCRATSSAHGVVGNRSSSPQGALGQGEAFSTSPCLWAHPPTPRDVGDLPLASMDWSRASSFHGAQPISLRGVRDWPRAGVERARVSSSPHRKTRGRASSPQAAERGRAALPPHRIEQRHAFSWAISVQDDRRSSAPLCNKALPTLSRGVHV